MKIRNYYNAISKGYNHLYGNEQLEKFEKVKKEVKGKVVDVGCGTGLITKKIKNSVGIDISEEMLKQFKGTKVQADAHFLPFKNDSFDTSLSLTVLQDTEHPGLILKEMKRISKKIIFTILKKGKWNEKKVKELLKKTKLKGKLTEEEKDWIFIEETNN